MPQVVALAVAEDVVDDENVDVDEDEDDVVDEDEDEEEELFDVDDELEDEPEVVVEEVEEVVEDRLEVGDVLEDEDDLDVALGLLVEEVGEDEGVDVDDLLVDGELELVGLVVDVAAVLEVVLDVLLVAEDLAEDTNFPPQTPLFARLAPIEDLR